MTIFSQQKLRYVAIFLLSIYHTTNAQLVYQYCYPRFGNYSTLSDYGTNIQESITQLASLASTSYYNTVSVGNDTEKVNALFSCRYDISSDACQSCVQNTLEKVPLCLRAVESIQFYQECTVHYSNFTIFSIVDENPTLFIYGLRNVSDTKFTTLLSETINTLIANAVAEFPLSSRYFATTEAKYSTSETIYALAQCNEDISSTECNDCLQNGFGNFTFDHPEAFLGQIFRPACILSYKLSSTPMTPPYDFTVRIVSSPPPPGNSTTPPTTGSPPDDDVTPSTPFIFPDEVTAPPPPSSPTFGGGSKSAGTKGMSSTTMASFLLVLLSLALLLQN